ncbi:hypothetical protein LX73_0726 [Fodinibius salinus]|uniref:Transcriptional coactivator p15 (PC4) C-terminal domain-containing protein n=1 Tax=Fodinibius salinus TaxID=860790 RepID=A0A5D3YQZ3_9BACT|nr:hypothetical protein [Fodinibius salinus]TYP95423.1 hypothetical protein LX73_0726 [Fodinibius salinus]
MPTDEKGNQFVEVSNVRVTYVSKKSRKGIKDWSKGDVLRIQAYRGNGNALHQGPELDLKEPDTILELIEALSRLIRGKEN